jgi:hypothetical protein
VSQLILLQYFLFELPSNLVLRRVGAAKWLGTIALCWGVVMIGMGFVHDWKVLTVCRTILGLFEAGKSFLAQQRTVSRY